MPYLSASEAMIHEESQWGTFTFTPLGENLASSACTTRNDWRTYGEYFGDLGDGDESVSVDVVHAERASQFVLGGAVRRHVQRRQELGERYDSVSVGVVHAEDVSAEPVGVAGRKQLLVDRLELALANVSARKFVLELPEPLVDLGAREVGALDQFVELFRRQTRLAVGLSHFAADWSRSVVGVSAIVAGCIHSGKSVQTHGT